MRDEITFAANLDDEIGRLCALTRYNLLDGRPDPRFDEITALVKAAFDVPIALVSLVDADRQWFLSRQGLEAQQTPRSLAFCNYTIQTRQVLSVPDASRDARFRDNPLVTGAPFIRSYHGAPLETPDGYNIGSLCVIDVKPRGFSAPQLDLLAKFAGLVVHQIEARQMARVDHLTGVLGRGALLEALAAETARCRQTFGAASLGILGVDDMTRINRTIGYGVGDEALRTVAEICAARRRAYDVVGRLEGDRFAILLPGAAEDEARAEFKRICAAVTHASIPARPDLRLTASIGIAAYDDGCATPELWLRAAEDMLLRAKDAGKNLCAG